MAAGKEDDFMSSPLKPSAKHNMTAAELCDNDDLITSLLLDPVMKFQTHKMRVPFNPPTDEQKAKARTIVAAYVHGGDLSKAVKDLFALEAVQSHQREKTLQQKKDFRDHVYNEESGFTLLPCDRYASENKQGGKLVATRHWRKGTVVAGLVGVIGEMSLAEEKKILKKDVNDFSVMHSMKCKRPQLWLGPVAFMNHDCRANCKLVSNERIDTAEYEICRNVAPAEELTLYYGADYFGKGNKECECRTCEREGKGIFPSRRTRAAVRTSVLLTTAGTKYALRQTVVRQDRATRSASPPSSENASSESDGKPRDVSVFHSLLLPLLISPSHEASFAIVPTGPLSPLDSPEAASTPKALGGRDEKVQSSRSSIPSLPASFQVARRSPSRQTCDSITDPSDVLRNTLSLHSYEDASLSAVPGQLPVEQHVKNPELTQVFTDCDVEEDVTVGDHDIAMCDFSSLSLVESDLSLDDRRANDDANTPNKFYAGVCGPETIGWCHW